MLFVGYGLQIMLLALDRNYHCPQDQDHPDTGFLEMNFPHLGKFVFVPTLDT